MGFFSWECKGCGRSLVAAPRGEGTPFDWMVKGIALKPDTEPLVGYYDGYGRLETNDGTVSINPDTLAPELEPCVWHERCWLAAGKPGFTGPSLYAEDQGYFIEEGRYRSEICQADTGE